MEWAVWVEWECNPQVTQTKIQKGQFLLPFFFICTKIIVMKSDEGFSDMSDKTILIDCLNENVNTFQHLENLKILNPRKVVFGGFLFNFL
ncbi:hypothetical protein OAA82_02000 [Pelagibacteraceae bacterium]|nr:hypothetical protein [Pelagibacteraceae bacterium]